MESSLRETTPTKVLEERKWKGRNFKRNEKA